MTLAQPPISAWPLIFLAVPLLVALVGQAARPAEAGWTGWAAGTAYFGSGLYWVAEAFFVDAARHGWMAPFAVLFLGTGLALFWALPFWLAARLRLEGAWLVPGLAALWTLSDYARTHVLTGFPWALVGYAWVESPVAQLASLVGPHGLGFLTLLAAGSLAALRGGGAWRFLPGLAALGLAGAWIWGEARLEEPVRERPDGLVVRLVQPNAEQELKWDPAQALFYFERQLAASAAPAGRRPGVVIWPETAIPWLLQDDAELRRVIAAAGLGAPVILGARRMEDSEGRRRWWNALFVLGPGGEVAAGYDKHHLVPFGEYVPFADFFERLGLTGLVGASFSPGPGPLVLAGAGLPPFLPLICYEAIFPHEMQARRRPDWIVQVTNDAWFGSSAGPWQHFAQSRMRAIEQGLPLARAANTGISAMFDPYGRVTAHLPLLTAGHVDAPLPAALAPTPYARTGDLPWTGLLAVFTMILAARYLKLRASS
ncbi:MAG TPA: apolipoprotein N-acyltransferase [Paracoccaceae bacterium]|nr:apolipoprotein N-acyltransferase [Paracoccaceae bacterium]